MHSCRQYFSDYINCAFPTLSKVLLVATLQCMQLVTCTQVQQNCMPWMELLDINMDLAYDKNPCKRQKTLYSAHDRCNATTVWRNYFSTNKYEEWPRCDFSSSSVSCSSVCLAGSEEQCVAGRKLGVIMYYDPPSMSPKHLEWCSIKVQRAIGHIWEIH